jgi:hypothetical protein
VLLIWAKPGPAAGGNVFVAVFNPATTKLCVVVTPGTVDIHPVHCQCPAVNAFDAIVVAVAFVIACADAEADSTSPTAPADCPDDDAVSPLMTAGLFNIIAAFVPALMLRFFEESD